MIDLNYSLSRAGNCVPQDRQFATADASGTAGHLRSGFILTSIPRSVTPKPCASLLDFLAKLGTAAFQGPFQWEGDAPEPQCGPWNWS